VLSSKTKEDIVGILVVVIDVNSSHWFCTAILMKENAHADKTPMDG
jgi:hypothetical protein